MCLILFSYDRHPDYRLILAANRDEFYERPTAPMEFWTDDSQILAGRDLQAGGTWMGVTRSGRFAALTNFRDPASLNANAPSRGELVTGFLKGKASSARYLDELSQSGKEYNGFNLLTGDSETLAYYSNRRSSVEVLKPGIYGLSNRFLDTPWPKIERGKSLVHPLFSTPEIDTEAIFQALADNMRPKDDQLPDTGIGLEWERILSPLFISSSIYGTRSSTVLLIGRDGKITVLERTFDNHEDDTAAKNGNVPGQLEFRFRSAPDHQL